MHNYSPIGTDILERINYNSQQAALQARITTTAQATKKARKSMKSLRFCICFCILMLIAANSSCSKDDRIPLQVRLTRSVSKLPFVIAADQALYEKYGLDIEIRMPSPEFDGGIEMPSKNFFARIWRTVRGAFWGEPEWDPDIYVAGHTPSIVRRMVLAEYPHRIAIASNDCTVRGHIIGSKDLTTIDDLKSKRLGISSAEYSVTGYIALNLARRMGWDPVQDISITLNGHDIEALRSGLVDAIIGREVTYAVAKNEGYPVLMDTSEWELAIAGNSIQVEAGWLDEATNREAARRFLQATVEGIALFHQDRELAFDVMSRWHGITDRDTAAIIYEQGRSMSRKPYPCYEGIANTFGEFDSNEMRKYSAEDFYDDSLVRELDEEGFIDSFYE